MFRALAWLLDKLPQVRVKTMLHGVVINDHYAASVDRMLERQGKEQHIGGVQQRRAATRCRRCHLISLIRPLSC